MSSSISPVYEHYLVPAKNRFPMSHAPYLADLSGHRLIVIWFSGSREWAKDVNLLSAVYHRDTGKWESITSLVSEIGYSIGNCVALQDGAGKLHLWYVRTKGYWHEGEIVHMVWPDLKLGFSSKTVVELPQGWLVRGRPVKRGGMVYMPVYDEVNNVSAVYCQDMVTEAGELMESMEAEGGLIHPTLVEIGDAEFRCFMRNPWAPNRIHYAYSMDKGATWSRPNPTELPNPNSGIDVTVLSGNRLLCAYNDSDKQRYPLSLAVSETAGMDWKKVCDLERQQDEFSYPSLFSSGREVYLAYTYKRESIKFVQFGIEDF